MTAPTTTPTADPIPSKRAQDLLFNAELWDILLNSSDEDVVDRTGVSRKTWAGAIALVSGTLGIVGKSTKAALDADLAWREGTVGWVLNDSTPAYNVVYRKTGAVGSGAWIAASDSLLSGIQTIIAAAAPFADSSNNTALGAESFGRFSGAGLSGATDNTSLGHAAGGSIVGGDRNTDVGRAAGRGNVSGSDNTRVGFVAGISKPSGNQNTLIGASSASNSATPVSGVTAVGYLALNNVAVNEAVAVGSGAGANLSTGARFTAVGTGAGTSHTTQDGCTFIGWGAGVGGSQTFTHSNQTAIGHQAICDWENQVSLGDSQVQELRVFGTPWAREYAFGSTIIGKNAGNRSTVALARVVIGYEAGVAGNSASDFGHVVIGYLAGNAGANNQAWVAIGTQAGQFAQNCNDCTFVGSEAGRNLGRHVPLVYAVPADETHIKSAGSDVTQGLPLPSVVVGATALGKNALRYNTIGGNNTGIGDSALGFTTTGAQNTAIGYVCGEGNVTGSFNAYGGQGVRVYMRSGDHNALWGYAIGAGVGSFGTYPAGGSFNAIVGSEAAYSWAGSDVSAVGYRAFYSMTGGAGGDVGVGLNAGRSVLTGGNNTFIGKNSGYHASQDTDVQNSMALGAGTYTTKNDQVVIGNTAVTEVVIAGVTFTPAQLTALKALL